MMDWILAPGGIVLIGIGLGAMVSPDWLWRLYSLEPGWRNRNPEKPEDWPSRARRQAYFFLAFGVLFVLLAFVLRV